MKVRLAWRALRSGFSAASVLAFALFEQPPSVRIVDALGSVFAFAPSFVFDSPGDVCADIRWWELRQLCQNRVRYWLKPVPWFALRVSNRSAPVTCPIGVLRWGGLHGPSEPWVSSNAVAARHTASCSPRFVWPRVLEVGSIDGIVLWIRALSTNPRMCWISVSIPCGIPSTVSHRFWKQTSCAAMNASSRSPSQTFDIASMS